MAKDIKLNSEEWRDIVFDGKNKQYGAYKLRATSSKRHVVAFVIAMLLLLAILIVPQVYGYIYDQVTKSELQLAGTNTEVKMTDVEEEPEEEEEEILPETPPPPPPPVRATIQFTPPVITEDSKVNEENLMHDQETLNKTPEIQIGSMNFLQGSTDKTAIDPSKAFDNTKVTGEGTGVKEKVFQVVEVMPSYPGGEAELFKYLNSNIKYPAVAAENGISGKVIITFVVGKDGSISNVKVARSLDPSCDREAVRVVKAMRNWIPGKQNGQSVAVEYTLPVNFQLQK